MSFRRPACALAPSRFGRGRMFTRGLGEYRVSPALVGDLRLFATTFAAGFLFVTILIA